jgi:hypothetical protein
METDNEHRPADLINANDCTFVTLVRREVNNPVDAPPDPISVG